MTLSAADRCFGCPACLRGVRGTGLDAAVLQGLPRAFTGLVDCTEATSLRGRPLGFLATIPSVAFVSSVAAVILLVEDAFGLVRFVGDLVLLESARKAGLCGDTDARGLDDMTMAVAIDGSG